MKIRENIIHVIGGLLFFSFLISVLLLVYIQLVTPTDEQVKLEEIVTQEIDDTPLPLFTKETVKDESIMQWQRELDTILLIDKELITPEVNF